MLDKSSNYHKNYFRHNESSPTWNGADKFRSNGPGGGATGITAGPGAIRWMLPEPLWPPIMPPKLSLLLIPTTPGPDDHTGVCFQSGCLPDKHKELNQHGFRTRDTLHFLIHNRRGQHTLSHNLVTMNVETKQIFNYWIQPPWQYVVIIYTTMFTTPPSPWENVMRGNQLNMIEGSR